MGGTYRIRINILPPNDEGIELGGCQDFYVNTWFECLKLMWKHRGYVVFVVRQFNYKTK